VWTDDLERSGEHTRAVFVQRKAVALVEQIEGVEGDVAKDMLVKLATAGMDKVKQRNKLRWHVKD
jgi:hypothetical protein